MIYTEIEIENILIKVKKEFEKRFEVEKCISNYEKSLLNGVLKEYLCVILKCLNYLSEGKNEF